MPSEALGGRGGIGPAQIGGSRTNGSDVTWSTGLKFRSRFFHIYVIGRGWNENVGERAGVKRLHAVYDSREARTVWLRWNLSSRGSLATRRVGAVQRAGQSNVGRSPFATCRS